MGSGTNGIPGAAIVVPFTNRTPGAPCGPRPPSFFHWRDFKDWVVGMVNRFIVDLTTKADKVSDGTTGNLVGIGDDGSFVDSGLRADGLQPLLTFDATPTAGSLNPVTSGGIKQAIDAATPSDYEQVKAQVQTNTGAIQSINGKIPANTDSQDNKLVNQAGLNSAMQDVKAHFRGFYDTWALVPTQATDYPVDADGTQTPGSNDYMAVGDASSYPVDASEEPLVGSWRFKYTGSWTSQGKSGWHPEFQYNESPLTQEQQAALDSGITADKVTKLDGIEAGAQVNTVTGVKGNAEQDYRTGNINLTPANIGAATSAQGAKADTAYQKPSGGIPKSDLTSGIQASLDKADSALQSAPVTDVTVNGTSVMDGTVAKVTLGTAAAKDVPASGNASASQVVMGDDTRLTNARTPTAHASTHAANGSDPITPSDIGALGNSGNQTLNGVLTIKSDDGGMVALQNTGGNPTTTYSAYSIKTHGPGYTWTLSLPANVSGTFALLSDTMRFSETVAYAVGAVVFYNGSFYRCTTAHSAGAWNASHFTEVLGLSTVVNNVVYPTAPTPTAGDDSTKVATTAFVKAAVDGATPNLDYVMRVNPETGEIYYTTPDTPSND